MSDGTTQFLAWWGAVLATLVFLWDIYKWRTAGPRIRMTVQANMRILGDPELEGKPLILVSATNIGDRPTTLESLTFTWYANWWQRIKSKSTNHWYIKNPGLCHSFPCKLELGERWDGRANWTEEYADLAKSGHLMCHLHYASSKWPVAKRVFWSKDETEKTAKG